MNILDENIIASQRQRLRSWRITVQQIGVDIARKGLQDEEIIPFLHQLHRPTCDLDLLGKGDYSIERLVEVFKSICGLAVEDDGLTFDLKWNTIRLGLSTTTSFTSAI